MFLSDVKLALYCCYFSYYVWILNFYYFSLCYFFYSAASLFFYKVFSSDSSHLHTPSVCVFMCVSVNNSCLLPGGAAGGVQREGGGVCFICSLLPACLSELLLTGSPTAAPPRWQHLLSCSLTQRGDDESPQKQRTILPGSHIFIGGSKNVWLKKYNLKFWSSVKTLPPYWGEL